METDTLLIHRLAVIGFAGLTALFCVVLHFEALHRLRRTMSLIGFHHPRPRMMLMIITMLLVHSLEIGFFACAYYLLAHHMEVASFTGLDTTELGDYLYYSAMVYTTVGFGDITPNGEIRVLTQIEALTGLLLITWSATYTFLEMRLTWERSDD